MYILMVATDAGSVFIEHSRYSYLHWADALLCAVSIMAVALGCYWWLEFVENRLAPKLVRPKWITYLLQGSVVLLCLLDLLSAFTGWVFYIGPDGIYNEGKAFWIQDVFTSIYLLIPTAHALYKLLRPAPAEQKREYGTYVGYIGLCFLAVWLGEMWETVPVFEMSVLLAVQTLFMTIYIDREHRLTQQGYELSKSRTAIMAELDTRVITDVIKICSSQARYAAQVKAQLSAGQSDEKTALQKKQMAELTAQKAEASKQYEKVIASLMLIADDRVRASVIEQATRLANAISDTDKAMEALKKKMEPNREIPMEYAQAHDLAHDLTAILKSGNLMEAQKILRMIVKRIDIDDNDLYYTLAGTPTARREKTGGNNAG